MRSGAGGGGNAGPREPHRSRGARAKEAAVPRLHPPATQPAFEELLHFFNESADLLCIADFDGRFKRLNPAWQPSLGWTLEELEAGPFLDFVHPDDRPATLAEMDKLTTGAPTVTFENRYRCKDGSWKWLQWTATPLRNLREIYAIARDVTRQKGLEEEILATLDRERERGGRELHDGFCQEMAGIAALSVTLARKLVPVAANESAAAREVGQLLRDAIQHAHDLARGFIPLHLHEVRLAPALREFCRNTAAIFKITCEFRCQPRPPKLDVIRKSHLYRIAQEAVSNAITHGRARRIDIALVFRKGQGTLSILDNGVGLGESLHQHPGIGQHTMDYRARQIRGSFAVARHSPRGTIVTCVFPVPPPEPKPSPHARKKDLAEKARKKAHRPHR